MNCLFTPLTHEEMHLLHKRMISRFGRNGTFKKYDIYNGIGKKYRLVFSGSTQSTLMKMAGLNLVAKLTENQWMVLG